MTPAEVDEDVRPFEVQRHIGNEGINDVLWMTHRIQLSLTGIGYRNLLTDFSRAVFRARTYKRPVFGWLIRAGSNEVRGISHLDAITRLRAILAIDPPSWDLSPEEAKALGQALLDAAEEPEPCPQCEVRAIEEPSSLTPLTGCATCATRNGL